MKSAGYTYKTSLSRIATKKGVSISLKAGDVIWCEDSNILLYIGWTATDESWHYSGWTNRYRVTQDGEYLILARFEPERSIASKEELLDKLHINTATELALGNFKTVQHDISSLQDNSVSIYRTNNCVKSINHRGFNTIAPENTLSAFRLSKRRGFDYVETDVSFTSDGVPVCLHDPTVDRTSDGTGDIGSMTFDEVRQLDFGSWKSSYYAGEQIPSFAEFMGLCKNLGLYPYVELKENGAYTDAQIQSVVDIANQYGMKDKVTWISTSHTFLMYVQGSDASARLGLVTSGINSSTIGYCQDLKTSENYVFWIPIIRM